MSFDLLGDVNYVAVLVAAVAWFILGGIWYAPPVLGRAWQRAIGMETVSGANPLVFLATLVIYFVTAVAIAMLAVATDTGTVGEAVVLGIVTGVGFAVALTAVGAAYEPKPNRGAWFWITGIFNLLGYTLVAIILALWP
ncbi:MAG: DUF1761 domain-containing protein [Actinomycetota bacterium]